MPYKYLKKYRWCFIFLSLFAFTACTKTNAEDKSGKPDKPVPVVVTQVKKQAANIKIELPGTILAWATTRMAAEIDGRVEKFFYQEGEYIQKGKSIVQLHTRPLELELDFAQAEKQQVANRLKELRTGTRVEVLDGARAGLGKAQARVDLTNQEFKRIKKLKDDGVLSVNEYDKAVGQLEEARAQFNEKKAQLDEHVAGPRIEQIQQQESSLSAAEAKVNIIKDQIQRGTAFAPFNGFLVKKETEIGQWLEKGDPLFTLIAVDPVKAEVHLPQSQFNKIQLGMSAQVIIETEDPNESNKIFNGEVIEKIQSGDPQSRTFPVRIKIDNPKSEIAVGMLVRVKFYQQTQGKTQLYVPKDALVRSPFATVVWRVDKKEDQTFQAEKVTVKPGDLSDSLVSIEPENDGIKENDWVVVHGNERLRPGNQVTITQSPAEKKSP
ncbi:MAG: efflux RND transporter periplasmic adaptor subunit [Nitrospinae bacterium]|nr:efflux RND transporter periplasmic adaptor subunit [Nitrospinota bacterium]MDA1110617.1 efflux RND transporter periplasmic adaptor subunit [Nitrospinota bacterium]